MDSFTPYHLPAIIFALLGVSALLLGGWGMYTAFPDSPKYHYSVSEFDESSSEPSMDIIQFTDLSETGQGVFLETLDRGRYETNQRASKIGISSTNPVKNYVVYQSQTYVFTAGTNYSGWWMMGVIAYGWVAVVGLITVLFSVWFVIDNQFKLPVAALIGVLEITLLGLLIKSQIIEPSREGSNVAIVLLWVLAVPPVLIWYILRSVEQHWDMSFSQRMER